MPDKVASSRKKSSSSSAPSEVVETGGRSEKMGLPGAISYIVGNIVGSGIFITPTSIYKHVNSVGLSLLVWVLAALISMLGSFCYVELGTSIRMSGGDFAYMCFMKWYPVAFSFMCIGCFIGFPAILAIQAQTFAEYVFAGFRVELDPTSDFWAKKLLGLALMWFLMFINFFSLKTFVSRFQIAATLAKVGATALVIGTGLYFLVVKGETDQLKEPFKGSTFTAGSFVSALFAGLYSYDGWDILNLAAGEIENPRRNMPRAIVIGMVSIAAIYVMVNVSLFTVLSAQYLSDSKAVAMDFADQSLGQAAFIMPIFVAILLIGSLNGTMFSASRYLQAVAKEGHLPSAISGIQPICGSPRVALVVPVLLAMIISLVGNVDSLLKYVAFVQWQRAFTMAALIWIRIRHIPVHPEGIRMPLIMPLVYCFVCNTLVIVTIVENFGDAAVGMSILLGGFVVYMLFVFDRTLPSLESYRILTRSINNKTTKVAQIIFDIMPEHGSDEDAARAIGGATKNTDKAVLPDKAPPVESWNEKESDESFITKL